MKTTLITAMAAGLLNVTLVLSLAPFLEGVLRKLTAVIQSRQGPPIWQPYYDLLKLLGKDDMESGTVPGMQRFAVYLAMASVLTVAWLVPMGLSAPLNDAGDAILLIYMLTLGAISIMLAGLAAGSTYSLLGISREMMTVITLEPQFVVAIIIGAIHTRSFRLTDILDGSLYASPHFPCSGLIMLGIMLFSFQAFIQRIPFDTTEAETEIMEGPLIEYSGPKLALLKYAWMSRLVIYCALFIALFVPWGNALWFPLNLLIFLVKILILVVGVTVVAATHARFRIDQAVRYYAGLLALSLVALIFAVYGY